MSVTETVSNETVSLRETLADSLDDSIADQAAVISDEFWENDVPADVEAVGKEVINEFLFFIIYDWRENVK